MVRIVKVEHMSQASPETVNQDGTSTASGCMVQHVVMLLLANERIKPVDTYRRLQAQYVNETLRCSKTSE